MDHLFLRLMMDFTLLPLVTMVGTNSVDRVDMYLAKSMVLMPTTLVPDRWPWIDSQCLSWPSAAP